MNFDKRLMLCEGQAITADAVSENTIQIGKNDASVGEPTPLFVFVEEAFNNLTSLTIAIQTCADSSFSSGVSTVFEETILLANLVKDAVLNPKYLPKGAKDFVRMKFTIDGTAPTTGKITAGVVDAIHEDYTDI